MNLAAFSPARVASRLVPALVLFSAAAQAVPQRPAVETFERTVPLASGGSFAISNVNGSIDIAGWDRDEVRISARKVTSGPVESLSAVRITVDVTSSSVSVATHYPESGSVEVNVEYRVRVPARVLLASVSTVNGAIDVQDVSGEGSLSTVNGNVTLARAAGLFSARSTNGGISLEFLSLSGGLDSAPHSSAHAALLAQTTNGSVAVALPAAAGAELDAETRNGDFFSELPLLARTASAGRSIQGRIGSGGPLLQLRTVNGSIRLQISRPLV